MDIPTVIVRLAAEQGGVITRAQAIAGGLTGHQIDNLRRNRRWRRVGRSTFLIWRHADEERLRRSRIRAAVLSLGEGAVAVFATAAELHGIAGLRRTEKIHVAVPGRASRVRGHRDPGVVVHQRELPPARVRSVDQIPTTDPLYTVADVILGSDRFSAVSVLDSALNRKLISQVELAGLPPLIRGRRGAVAARRYLTEADGRAQSPLETRVRLRCVDGRVPPDELQFPVRDPDGYIVAATDLAWRTQRVAAEADGAGPHGTPSALYEDRRRQNRLADLDWLVLRFTWSDALRPDYIPMAVRQALSQRTPR